ncbi:MAG: flagellar basal-body MS-ring/collar protein FliF [Pseudomonadaceae bacterium]|nr:flagellar basal-body MS-ring/collar protein FliF [Pseudomonadaceae bacterium]
MAEAAENLPAVNAGPGGTPASAQPGGAVQGSAFLSGASSMPLMKQFGLMVALAASVAAGVAVVLWMQTPDYRPLTGMVSPFEANEIVNVLQPSGIPFRIDERTGMIQVPADSIHEARMTLAGSGVVDTRQLGYELLDQDKGFGVSQFMEAANHRRSVEGELARSIATITAVQQARVLVALPKSSSFLRDQRKPSASVTVMLLPGKRLGRDQIQGITNLVAGAIPELEADQVTVVDQSGELLSKQDEDSSLARSEQQLRYINRLEDSLHEKVNALLRPIVGAAGFTAQVSADVDFTWVEQTEELYNPDLPALRSEQRLEEQRSGSAAAQGIPGALTNQPPAAAAAPEIADQAAAGVAGGATDPSQSRVESTRNFELDRTISHTRQSVGKVQRLSISVLLDDLPAGASEEGQALFEPWSEAEIARITESIKSAVGYSAARGDSISVMNTPFLQTEIEEIQAVPIWQQPWLLDLVKQIFGGLAILTLLFVILRPMVKSVSSAARTAASMNNQTLAMVGANLLSDESGGGDNGEESALLPLGSTPYSAKLDTVRSLVADDPGRVAQVVKHWVSEDG